MKIASRRRENSHVQFVTVRTTVRSEGKSFDCCFVVKLLRRPTRVLDDVGRLKETSEAGE